VSSAGAGVVLFLTGTASGADLEHGRQLVDQLCGRCHATGPTGDSQTPEAIPFRLIKTRYPVDDLAESLAEGISTGHPQMPEYSFQPNDIDDILEYLRTL
jgi:mono/diheme cytochrome c family protein